MNKSVQSEYQPRAVAALDVALCRLAIARPIWSLMSQPTNSLY